MAAAIAIDAVGESSNYSRAFAAQETLPFASVSTAGRKTAGDEVAPWSRKMKSSQLGFLPKAT